MTQPAQAFAAGNPASAAGGIAQSALAAALPGLGGVSVPGFTSSSSSGDIGQTFGTDSSGWSVNIGGANLGTGANAGMWLAAAMVVGLLLWRKKST